MRKFKQWLKSVLNPSKEYYLLHGRDEEVTVFNRGKESKMDYWDFIEMTVDLITED